MLSKTSAPQTVRALERPRLFDDLDATKAVGITWVWGAPGAGKTTLASSYLVARGGPAVWYRLDVDDADPATFFHYLDCAVANLASAPMPRLFLAQFEERGGHIRRVAESMLGALGPGATLVFDNYEHLQIASPVHEVVRDLADLLAPRLHVMVLSRTEPPAPYARMQLNEGLVVLEPEQLKLRRDEAAALVLARERTGRPSSPELVERLLRDSEGWFAGFTLLLVQHTSTAMATAKPLRVLFDYFATEVFEHFEPKLQAALLRTSVLLTMTAAEAQRISGYAAIGDALAELQRRNCFCDARDGAEPVYRYHALFRMFLLDRAATAIPPDEWQELQRCTADPPVDRGRADAAPAPYRGRGDPYTAAVPRDRVLRESIAVEDVRRKLHDRSLAPPDPRYAAPGRPWSLRIVALGRFEVVRNGAPLRAAGKAQRKPLELLQCLCAFGGEAVAQDRIADALWPEAEGDAAKQALRTTLHRLRKLLQHKQAVRLENRQLDLDPGSVWVDSTAFERIARSVGNAGAARLQEAMQLYRGGFLPGESAPWALVHRDRLRARFVTVAERLGALLEQAGDRDGAIACYLHTLELEPGAEGFYRRLMALYGHSGRRADAIGVYQRCRGELLTRLGISPASETQAMHLELLAQ